MRLPSIINIQDNWTRVMIAVFAVSILLGIGLGLAALAFMEG